MEYFDWKETSEDHMSFWQYYYVMCGHESVCKGFVFVSFGLVRLCQLGREHMLSCWLSFRKAGGDHKY